MKRDVLPFVHMGMIGAAILWNLLCALWIIPLDLYRVAVGILVAGNAGVIVVGVRSGSSWVTGTWWTCKTDAERRARIIGVMLAFLWVVTLVVCTVKYLQT